MAVALSLVKLVRARFIFITCNSFSFADGYEYVVRDLARRLRIVTISIGYVIIYVLICYNILQLSSRP
jgi:hypothetical protein